MTTTSPTPEDPSASAIPKNSAAPQAAAIVGLFALVAGAIYLLKTNPLTGNWMQGYDPTGHWWLSTAIAALPVAVLLGTMAILRLKAHLSA